MTSPAIDHLLTMTATLYRRTESVDASGDLTITEADAGALPCFLERLTILELREGEEIAIMGWRGYFLPGFAADAGDRLEVNGRSLELMGPAEPITNARAGTVHHAEARLREVA